MIKDYEEEIKDAESMIDDLPDSVFVSRFRDVVGTTPTLSIKFQELFYTL